MALNTFGWTPSEVTTDSAGNVISGVTLTVFTDVTKATQVTGLMDKDGVTPLANNVVVSDNKGRFGFKASDAYSLLYVYDGSTADPWPIAAHEALDQGMASHAQAVADAQAAADSAAQSAALVNAPADTVMKTTVSNTATQTGAYIAATFAPVKASLRGSRVVWLGDSITIGQGNEVTDPGPQGSWGATYPSFATYASKGRVVRVRNAGVSGNRAVDMLNRFDADVASQSPSVVSIMAGTNDWNDAGPTPLATYQQNIRDLIAKCRAIGAQPVLCTVPPNVLSSARRQRTIVGNTWLRRYAAEQGIPLVDFYTMLTDPATGDYLAAYGSASNDKTHPILPGYKAMGNLWWSTLTSFFPPVDALLPGENADPNNKLTNGLFLTTTGSGTSLMPTGWSVQSSVHAANITGSLVTGDANIKGNWWQIAAAGAVATDNEFQSVSGIIPGHVYAFTGRFKATGMRNADTGSGSTFLIGCAFNSALLTAGHDFRVVNTMSYDVPDGTFYQEVVAPSDATTCLIRFQLIYNTTSSGTLQVAQFGFYDLTAMGLA